MRWLSALIIVLLAGCAPKPELTFNGAGPVTINVEVADDREERARGLMYRDALAADAGMLFVFPDLQFRSFWMKNVKFPIDVIFLDHKLTVTEIKTLQPCARDPCPAYPTEYPAQYAVEVVAGFAEQHGIRPGTTAAYAEI